jgi:hypothetical protein
MASAQTLLSPGATARRNPSAPGQASVVSGGHDACASASLILGTGPYFGSNVGATTDGPAACGSIGADVWYEWIAPVTAWTSVTTCRPGTTFDTVLAVYDGGCGGALLACNDDALACLFGGTFSSLSFYATGGESYRIRVGGHAGATGTYEMRVMPTVQIGSDSCATPHPVSGPGPHDFDTSVATTGPEGQANAACDFSGTTGIDSDVWFVWTAPASGSTTVSTCGQTTFDTKLAVHAGSACPVAAPLGCNDGACATQASVTFSAVVGQISMSQRGVFPGARPLASGTFTITGPQPANGCSYDDGISVTGVGLGGDGGGEQVFLQGFGSPGDLAAVRSISVSYGSPLQPGSASPVGTRVVLSIFDDPNDDGIPDDLVLVAIRATVVHDVDGDQFAASAFEAPVVVDGVYFAAVSVTSLPGDFPLSIDDTNSSGGRSWFVGEPGKGLDYSDLPSHTYYGDIEVLAATAGSWMIRVDCQGLITPFCFPGSGGVVACPCGNAPSGVDRGCNNHGATSGGASLAGSGSPSLASDSLVLSATGENASALTVFWTGSATNAPPGVAHGAGVRCVTGLKRLYSGAASGGAVARPGMGDASVSARTAAVGSPITAGQTRYYFNIYRDPAAAGPCGNTASTVNLTSAVSVLWVP